MHIRMTTRREKSHLRWHLRVLIRDPDVNIPAAALVRRVGGTQERGAPMGEVVLGDWAEMR
jgi:hypothetical protein